MRTRDNLISFLMKGAPSLAAILVLGILAQGCSKKEPPPPPAPDINALLNATPPVPQEAPKEKPVYVYSADKFRDPFMPAGQAANYKPDAVFDPARAQVKAIIYGDERRGAVLSLGSNGTYFVNHGKIFDIMGKTVEGYTARVFIDKVIVLGEADASFELKIRSNSEDEEEKS